jgi:hypothetical protein
MVLVHGAFTGSSSCNGVIKMTEKDGYTIIAAANPPVAQIIEAAAQAR